MTSPTTTGQTATLPTTTGNSAESDADPPNNNDQPLSPAAYIYENSTPDSPSEGAGASLPEVLVYSPKRMLLVCFLVCFVSVAFVVFRSSYYYHGGLGWIAAFFYEAVNSACPLVFASYIRPVQQYSKNFAVVYSLICILRFSLYVYAAVFGGDLYYFLGVYFLGFAFVMECFGKDWELRAEPTFAKYGSIGFVLLAISMFVTPFYSFLSDVIFAIAALYIVVLGIWVMFRDRPLDKEQRTITDEDGNEEDYLITNDGYYFGVSYRSRNI